MRELCSLQPIEPRRTCLKGPCLNLACRALIHYHAVFETAPGRARPWPSCNFNQERLGTRSHNDAGAQKLDECQPRAATDASGAIAAWGEGYSLKPVAGKPNTFELDFYDMPGWAVLYPVTREPNAYAPKWFPIDWHYMYRAYFGPKRQGISEAEYHYVRVDMAAASTPEPAIALDQKAQTSGDWARYQRELEPLSDPICRAQAAP
ncbi:MAG: hypothetical protein HY077_12285 [Elusimicrobia bacterium]|nr:hypothetical protein [Elusimicrobiota bacterium]